MELLELVRKLRRKLNKYKNLYSQNEAAVREQVVSPLLKALRWNPENPAQVIPEYPFTIDERGKKKRIKLDYALMRRGDLFAVFEVKALGRVEEGLGRAFTSAQATGARYIIITDGDTWRLYDTSRPITEALISEWSLLREKSKEVSNKIQIIANLERFGSPKALLPVETQPREKPQECPHCSYKGDFSLLGTWKYRAWNVYHYKCPKCGGKFRFYMDPKGIRKSFIIFKRRREK